jgi:photosystem II stability/assembly factor-like uncharacterized protein
MQSRVPVLAALLVLLVACTHGAAQVDTPRSPLPDPGSHSFHVVEKVEAELVRTPPPPSAGPVAAVDHFDFVTPTLGFLAGRPNTGSRAALIQRTSDGGATWRTVWRGRRSHLRWIGVVDGSVRAFGLRFPQDGSVPFALESADRGRTWIRRPVELPHDMETAWYGYDFHFLTSESVVAVADIAEAPCCSGPPLVSRDGGATWDLLAFGRGFILSVDFVSASVGFAGVSQPKDRACRSSVWKTVDGGADWSLLPASCTSASTWPGQIAFADESAGFFGAGDWDTAMGRGRLVLFATTDGGRTWERRWSGQGGPTIARLWRDAAGILWLAEGGCSSMGGDGPCVGPLRRSSDGRSWIETEVSAYAIDEIERSVWGSGSGSPIARSRDAGETWTTFVRPEGIWIKRVAWKDGDLFVRSLVGTLRSSDEGFSWIPAKRLPPRAYDPLVRSGRRVVVLTSRTIAFPKGESCGPASLSADGRAVWVVCGQGLYVTADEGASFVEIRLPESLHLGSLVGLSDTEAWASGGFPNSIWHSIDGGRTWERSWVRSRPDPATWRGLVRAQRPK